jgi:hypothetical protein
LIPLSFWISPDRSGNLRLKKTIFSFKKRATQEAPFLKIEKKFYD